MAHHVDLSKRLTERSASDTVVKVYGEANPSKTDENLSNAETNTQIMNFMDYMSSLPPSGESIQGLSISGYGPPEEELNAADTNQQIETIKEMEITLSPDVENPYGSGILDAGAEQRKNIAETSPKSNREEESKITNIEQAGVTRTTKSEEDFRKIGDGITEDGITNANDTELIEVCGEDCKISTEGSVGTDEGFTETVTGPSEASTDSKEGDTISSTGDSKASYNEQFKSTSIGTEATEMPTIQGENSESVFEGYGAVSETERGNAEVTLSESVTDAPSESVTESPNDGITQTGAEDFGYGEAAKEQSNAGESSGSISGNLSGAYETETATVPDVGETAYTSTSSLVTDEETKYIGKEETYENSGKPDLKTEGIYSSEQRITDDQSTTLATLSLGTVKITSPVMSSIPADNSYITESTDISKIVSSSDIKSVEGIPGYEIYGESENTATGSKAGLPALDKESASELSKSVEEAATFSTKGADTKMTNEKATNVLESKEADSNAGATEITEFPKEASLTSVEQLSEYGAITPKYTEEFTHREEEATEVQKTVEEIDASAKAPYATETSYAEEKAVPGDTSITSGGVSNSVSNKYGASELVETSEEPSESKEGETASEGTLEISKSDEGLGLVGYGEASASEQASTSTEGSEIISTEKLEESTQSNELQTMKVSEQPINYNGESATSESNVKETKIDDTTMTFVEQSASSEKIASEEVTRSGEESLGHGELSAITDSYHDESNKEASSEQATTYGEQVKEYGLPTSNQDVATSEANVIAGEGVHVTESTSAGTNSADFGYGGEGITEKGNSGSDEIDTSVNSALTKNVEETAENSYTNQLHAKSMGEEADYKKQIEEANAAESVKQTANGSVPGYSATENLNRPSDYYPATDGMTNELSPSGSSESKTDGYAFDGKLIGQSEAVKTTSIIPEISEMASVDGKTTSLTSASSELEASIYTVSEEEKFTETPTSETSAVQTESNEMSTDKHDFGYGGGHEEVTETSLIGQTEDSKKLPMVANETKTESVQQSEATETSPGIETDSTVGSIEISQQYQAEISDTVTSSPNPYNEAVGTIGVSETDGSGVHSETYSQLTTEIHVITNGIDTPITYGINEEAPKVVAITKVTKTGPSKLTGDIIASTEEARNEVTANAKTTQKIYAEGTKYEETTSEEKNEMSSISSKTTLESVELPEVTTTTSSTESESYSENTVNIPAKIPMGPEDFGYGNANEQSTFIISDVGSAKTTIPQLLTNPVESSISSELSASSEYANSETLSESESRSGEEFSVTTAPSASPSALTESAITATQKILTTYSKISTSEEQEIPLNIPSSAKDFGYGDVTEELSNTGGAQAVISEGQMQRDQSVVSNTGRPFTINCNTEVDEEGDLCREWTRAGLCDTHRPTMFLFCRRTCLCVGPPTD
uniref:VWFA domain-containing protein n=1 Tax=Elaeophora elaphi TaxID=1147741 RepID=A0A0R3RHJ0_9BILA